MPRVRLALPSLAEKSLPTFFGRAGPAGGYAGFLAASYAFNFIRIQRLRKKPAKCRPGVRHILGANEAFPCFRPSVTKFAMAGVATKATLSYVGGYGSLM